jgi:hypothetical protein
MQTALRCPSPAFCFTVACFVCVSAAAPLTGRFRQQLPPETSTGLLNGHGKYLLSCYFGRAVAAVLGLVRFEGNVCSHGRMSLVNACVFCTAAVI